MPASCRRCVSWLTFWNLHPSDICVDLCVDLCAFECQVLSYPKALGVAVSVGHASIASARGGTLFSTAASTLLASRTRPEPPPPSAPAPAPAPSDGPLIAPWDQPSVPAAAAAAAAITALLPPQEQPQAAFLLDFVSQPQDGSADAVLELLIAPSFVSYSPSALTSIRAFFARSGGSEGLQLTTLQVWEGREGLLPASRKGRGK